MVTKLHCNHNLLNLCSVLAKILMVTKLLKSSKYMKSEFCSSKNPYGNKTCVSLTNSTTAFCSSKNPYGNKTGNLTEGRNIAFCSSKNPYGNKTIAGDNLTFSPFCSSKNPYGNKTVQLFFQ